MPKKPDPPEPVPGWIISFSDMITLLLAFFVLLQSFAYEIEEGLFYDGQASFKRAINGLGIPSFVLGVREEPGQDYMAIRHAAPETAASQDRPVYDPQDEMIRERFSKIMQEMDSDAVDNEQQPIGSPQGFNAEFDGTGHGLVALSEAKLATYARSLGRDVGEDDVLVYVVGFAKGQDHRKVLMLSALRAQAVARTMRKELSAEVRGRGWRVVSWGGGTGADWASAFGINADHASIAIAVMGAR